MGPEDVPPPADAPRLTLFPRSAEVQRLDRVLSRAGQRLDRLDPPPGAAEASGPEGGTEQGDDLRPVLRALPADERVPRADA